MKLSKIFILLILFGLTLSGGRLSVVQAADFDRSISEARLTAVMTDLTTKIELPNSYQLKVVKNKRFNAYALPGGIISVTTGTLKALDDDALQVLLLHEMAHEVLNHPLSQKARLKCSQQELTDYEIAADNWAADMMAKYHLPLSSAEKFLHTASKLAPNSRWGFHPSYEMRLTIFRQRLTSK